MEFHSPRTRKHPVLLCFAVTFLLPVVLTAQEDVLPELSELEFDEVELSQAGPDSFYIRSARAGDEYYSLRLAPSEAGGLQIIEILPERENLLPRQTILDFATVQPQPDGSIVIDGVIIENEFFSGVVEVTDSNRIVLSQMLTMTSEPRVQRDRLAAVLRLENELEGLGDDVGALVQERDQLRARVADLSGTNEALSAQVEDLQQRIANLSEENSALREDLSAMTAEADRLRELLASNGTGSQREETAPESDNAAGASSAAEPEWSFPGDYVRTADLRAAAAAVANELAALSQRIRSLESSVEEADMASLPAPSPGRAEAEGALADSEQAERIARLQAQIAELQAENDRLRGSQQILEGRVIQEILNQSLVGLMRAEMNQSLASGFPSMVPDTGSWDVSGSRAVQRDPDAYFAKAAVEVVQSETPTLYGVTMESLEERGWAGVGLHLFVSNVERRRGYGMGQSLLVWLTRDPARRGTDATYLQIYRSDNDVVMERVVDARIEESVSDELRVEVLYEPVNQYITVAVNGQDKVRYRTWFDIETGVELALRSLGRAEFQNLQVSALR
ncbi:MAG: hypothetical protein ACOC8L_13250 [Spirochaetota bacterium]